MCGGLCAIVLGISCHRRCQFKANLIWRQQQPQQQHKERPEELAFAPAAILKPLGMEKKGQSKSMAGKWKLQFLTGPAAASNMPLSIKSHWPTDSGNGRTMYSVSERVSFPNGIANGHGNGMSCHICASIAAVVLQQFAKIASEFRPNVTTMTAATSSTTAAAASAT